MKKQKKNDFQTIAIFGLGRFGRSLAKALARAGKDVMAVDCMESHVNLIVDDVLHAIIGDATNEEFLESLGVGNFDAAIVAIGNDVQASTLVALKLKELGVKHVVARARDELHARLLTKVGVDRVVEVEQEMGKKIAKSLGSRHYIDSIMISADHSIVEIGPLPGWQGRTAGWICHTVKDGISIIAVKRDEELIARVPDDFVVKSGDLLVIMGPNELLDYIY